MTESSTQQMVTRNVRVMMAVRDMREQRELAEALGWSSSRVTKTLKGDRKWSIDDVVEVAKAFHIEPGTLLGDTASLVGASGRPAQPAAAGATTGTPIRRYVTSKHLAVVSSHQVGRVERSTASASPDRSASTRVVITRAA